MRTQSEYGIAHKTLHWIIFGLLAAQYAVGSLMPHITRRVPDEGLVAWHMSIGVAILFFIIIRLGLRTAKPVGLLPTMPAWQRHLASFTHITLYVFIFAMCILGWAAASGNGWTIKLFGVIPLPALAPDRARWAHTAGDIHDILLYVLLAPIALHIAAALYHQFILKDGILKRMLIRT